MDTLLQDLRLGARSLWRAPAFTLVAVLTLALGIGANTAIFSVVYGVLLRPLPYPEPDRLVTLSYTYGTYRGEKDVTYRQFRFLQDNAGIFERAAASASVGFNVLAQGQAFRVDGLRVSRDWFRVLGVAPALGRAFTTEEDAEGGPGALILSHALWRRRFASDSGVVGMGVSVDGAPFTIVGVMPAGFRASAEAWSTLAQVGRSIGGGDNLMFVARLAPDRPFASAQAAFQALVPAYREAFDYSAEQGLEIDRLQEAEARDLRTPVRVLFGAVGFVLLIACANVANLLLGRTTMRGREIAVRAALGASRGRIAQQLLTESVLLALAGGAVGLLVAGWGLNALLTLAPPSLTNAGAIGLDGWALGFAAGASVLTGLAFGLAPAWRAARLDLHEGLKAGTRSGGAARQGSVRAALVVAEVALSLVLLVGAGLLVATLRNLVRTDPGFDTRNLLTAEIWLTGSGRDSTAQIAAFYDEVIDRLEAFPGVRAAAVVEAGLPLQRGGNLGVLFDGRVVRNSIEYRTATPGYLSLLGVPLVEGRMLRDGDATGGEPVVVVSRAFARAQLGDSSALGHTIQWGRSDAPRRIVGVVGDIRSFIARDAAPAVFVPSSQTPARLTRLFSSWYPTHVVLRSAGDPASLRELLPRAIRDADARVPVGRIRSMEEVLAGSLAFQRFLMLLLTVFAVLAVALATVGIYGVISFLVTQRTREIGVRMALGARTADVVRMVLRRGLTLAAVGAVLGLGGAVGLTRLLRTFLYGVRPVDLPTFAAVTLLLVGVALGACWIPAHRAARTDPMVALRSE